MLILRIIRWLAGYVLFEIHGTDGQRFLTAAASHGLVLWNMQKQSERCYSACITAKKYRNLRFIAKKKHLRLCVKKRVGLPFYLKKWRRTKRYGLLMGAVGALVLMGFLSSRVWVVAVSGNTTIAAEEICTAAEEAGLWIGVNKSGYNPIAVENHLMLEYPELSWVTVNTWGSTVDIVVQEGDARPEMENDMGYGNIMAARSGQILSMDVYHGKALVKTGDGVAAGQMLVSGVLNYENGTVDYTQAAAKIMAQTRRSVVITIPKEEILHRETGKIITRKSLRIFGIPIPLTLQGVPCGNYEKESTTESIQLNGVDLPLTICEEFYREQEDYTVTVTEQDAEKRGEVLLQKFEETLNNGEILSKKRTVTEEKKTYKIRYDCVCLENIAVEKEFFVEMAENDPWIA